MRKMRHFADEDLLRLGQKPAGAQEETPASSDMNSTPMALGMKQSSVVCFPLVSESRKLVWVQSHQIDAQITSTAELDEAFDRFPYLTHNETTELAERCSLHPDQVKAWFMAQRLRYGISWDYEDICEVRRKFNSSQEKKELQNGTEGEVMEDGREKREMEGPGGSAKEKGVRGESMKVNEQLEREMEERKEEKSMQKRKKITVTEKMGKKRVKQAKEEMMAKVESDKVESEGQKCTKSEEMPRGRKRRNARVKKSLKSTQEKCEAPQALSSLLDLQSKSQTFNASLVPDNQTHLLHRPGDPHSTADGDLEGKKEKEAEDLPTPSTRLRCKTPAQLAMMKMAFLRCQYPDKEHYNRLVRLIGIPRLEVVQWFGDMRYFIKRGRPRWMNQEQHHQVLASIKYRQYMTALAKVESAKSMNSWMTMLEGSKGYSEGENMKISPE